MAKPDFVLIEGRAYSWQEICELRREQRAARCLAQPQQLVLFELKTDHRPQAERSGSGRYEEPSLLNLMRGG